MPSDPSELAASSAAAPSPHPASICERPRDPFRRPAGPAGLGSASESQHEPAQPAHYVAGPRYRQRVPPQLPPRRVTTSSFVILLEAVSVRTLAGGAASRFLTKG